MNRLEMFKQYEGYVYSISKQYCLIGNFHHEGIHSYEDLCQYGRLELWRGILAYERYKKNKEEINEQIEEYNKKVMDFNKYANEFNGIMRNKGLSVEKQKVQEKLFILPASSYLYQKLDNIFKNLVNRAKIKKRIPEGTFFWMSDHYNELDQYNEIGINYKLDLSIDFNKIYSNELTQEEREFINTNILKKSCNNKSEETNSIRESIRRKFAILTV